MRTLYIASRTISAALAVCFALFAAFCFAGSGRRAAVLFKRLFPKTAVYDDRHLTGTAGCLTAVLAVLEVLYLFLGRKTAVPFILIAAAAVSAVYLLLRLERRGKETRVLRDRAKRERRRKGADDGPKTEEEPYAEANPVTEEAVSAEANPVTEETASAEVIPVTEKAGSAEVIPVTEEAGSAEAIPMTEEAGAAEAIPAMEEEEPSESIPAEEEDHSFESAFRRAEERLRASMRDHN